MVGEQPGIGIVLVNALGHNDTGVGPGRRAGSPGVGIARVRGIIREASVGGLVVANVLQPFAQESGHVHVEDRGL